MALLRAANGKKLPQSARLFKRKKSCTAKSGNPLQAQGVKTLGHVWVFIPK